MATQSSLTTSAALASLASMLHPSQARSVCDFDTPYACNTAQRAALAPVSQSEYAGFDVGPAVTCVVGSTCGAMPLGACAAAGGTVTSCCPGEGCNKFGTPGFASDKCAGAPMSTQATLLSFAESAKLAKRSQSSTVADLAWAAPAQLAGVSTPATFATPGAQLAWSSQAQLAPGATSTPAVFSPGAQLAWSAPGQLAWSAPAQLAPGGTSVPASFAPDARLAGAGQPGAGGFYMSVNPHTRQYESPTVYSPIVVANNTGPVRIMSSGQARGQYNTVDNGFSSASADGSSTPGSFHPPAPVPVIPTLVCPSGTQYNPVSQECSTVPGFTCPPGMVFDSVTRRCIPGGGGSGSGSGHVFPYVPNGICGLNQHYDPFTRTCVNDPAPNPMCPAGTHFDPARQGCVLNPPAPNPVCPAGMHFEPSTQSCVSNSPAPNPSVHCGYGATYSPLLGKCVPLFNPGACGSDSVYSPQLGACVPKLHPTNPIEPFSPVTVKGVKAINKSAARLLLGSVVAADVGGTAVLPRGKKLSHGASAGMTLSSPHMQANVFTVNVEGKDGAGHVVTATYIVPVSSMGVGVPVHVHPSALSGDLHLGVLMAQRVGKKGDVLELTVQ